MTPDGRLLAGRRSRLRTDPYRGAAAGLALVAGVLVFVLAHELFPYHSVNHDEGVYLQQAAMLLEGRLFLTPGAEPLREAVRPWFFVAAERGLYPRYSPVPAAVFALGKLAGGYRLALAAVAAFNVALAYTFVGATFDRRTGLLAATILAAAPTFLLTSSVFLPYAPTTMFNLLFAVAYVRSVRRRDARYAAVAGAAIGLAFFARPFTAVLFAAPFVVHALWRLARIRPPPVDRALPYAVTAGIGLAFVGVTLAYNHVVTGSALLFPYEAFAPRDGLGFGRRVLLGHNEVYTPALALRTNAAVLWALATDWFTAGPLGTAAACGGLALAGLGIRRGGLDGADALSRRQLQLVLVGVVVSVCVGNVLFWGNRNILADIATPGDGLLSLFGPFYHFDLLVPLSAFAAHGVVTAWDGLHDRLSGVAPARLVLASLLVTALPVVAVAEAGAFGPPVERNAAYTDRYERAYAPFRSAGFSNALVFLPPAYGEWRNHPFQWLRNDPGFDGPAVYALSRGPTADFDVLDAFAGRTAYRYRYHGEWTPDPSREVIPVLERVRTVEGTEVTGRTTVAVPDRIVSVSIALSNGEAVRRYDLAGAPPDRLAVVWTVTGEGARVEHPDSAGTPGPSRAPVPIDGPEALELTVTITEPSGPSLTYRERVLVRPTADGVQVLWPPASSVCTLVTDCGLTGTYVPDRPETRPDGIVMRTTLHEVER